MAARAPMLGRVFGRLTVAAEVARSRRGDIRWLCGCSCGGTTVALGSCLRSGKTASCGCLRRDRAGTLNRTHGLSGSVAYDMWCDARKRAKARGFAFEIEITDVRIPERCPVLGLILEPGARRQDSSPTLDRVDTTRGYVPGNVAVISWRANKLKGDATPAELRALHDWLATVLP